MGDPAVPGAADNGPIGLLGCGRMGRPMVQHILAAGWTGAVFDTNAAAADGLERCVQLGSAREAGNACEIVLGCLPTAAAYEKALFGADGLIHGDRVRIYVHLGTSGPGDVGRMADAFARRGIDVLDAPITGGVSRAVAGSLVTLLSGAPTAVARTSLILSCYSSRIVEFGDRPGQAQAAKLINNMISAANLAVAVEGFLMGAKAGLPADRLFEVLSLGTGNSDALINKVAPHVLPRTFEWGSRLEVIGKDMAAWKEMADDQQAVTAISRLVHKTYEDAIAALGDREDMTSIARYLERIDGVTIGASG